MPPTRRRMLTTTALACAAAMVAAACGGSPAADAVSAAATSAAVGTKVRLGYFPNLTHAPGLVADAEGYLTRRLTAGVDVKAFNAGPDVVQALFAGSLDIAYIGPSPTVTAYTRSQGAAVRVIAGSTSGGAALVVRPGITDAAGLRGRKVATPQLGNTQDVALRHWLREKGLTTTPEGGGDVRVEPQKNSAAVVAFAQGAIDGAWVPEPFVSQLVAEGGTVLVDERDLWPDRKFLTTNVLVRTQFLAEHPAEVRAFLDAHLDALDLLRTDPDRAHAQVLKKIKALTDQEVPAAAAASAWKTIEFTPDPLAATLRTGAEHAKGVELLEDPPTDGFAQLWDLGPLNAALAARQLPAVTS